MKSSKQDYLRELELSRNAIRRDFSAVCEELNFPRKVQNFVRKNPAPWIAGAAAIGFLAAGRKAPASTGKKRSWFQKRRSDENSEETAGVSVRGGVAVRLGFWGFLLGAIKLLVPMLKPALSAYATKRMAEMAGSFAREKK